MTDLAPTALLASHVRRMRHAPMAAAVRQKAVLCLLDAVALGRCAAADPTVTAVGSVLSSVGTATVWASGARSTPSDAALANGIAAHAQFQDDTDMDAWAHPGSLIVPAAVALAEHRGAPLEVLVRGVVAGYTALNWLGAKGVVGGALVERGFRASPTLGSIAAAVSAATVLDLDERAATHAIGLATDVTGGLLEPVRTGAQDWRWQNGTAAWRGVLAGLLAEAGVRGPAEPLAGPKGFLAAFCGIDVPEEWTSPPAAEAIHQVWFKRYPILGDNMAPAVAAAWLHGRIGDPAEVSRVDVHINEHFAAYPGTSHRGPFDTVEQAMASTAFAVAALLVDGDLRHADYPRVLGNPLVAELVGKVTVVAEPDFGYLDSTVTVTSPTGTWSRRTEECAQEEFFRDRDAARAAFRRTLPDSTAAEAALPDRLFDWLDGGAEPALAELVRAGGRGPGAGAV